jgi:hypothetical protein
MIDDETIKTIKEMFYKLLKALEDQRDAAIKLEEERATVFLER